MDNRKIGHKYVEEISIETDVWMCLYLYGFAVDVVLFCFADSKRIQ